MSTLRCALTLCFAHLFVLSTFPLSVTELASIVGVAQAESDGSIVLSVEYDYNSGGDLYEVTLEPARELYIRPAAIAEIVGSEPAKLDWEDLQIASEVRTRASVVSLAAAYATAVRTLAARPEFAEIGPEDFYAIGYDVEYRRPVIELTFRRGAGRGRRRVDLYIDIDTGGIISIRERE